MRRAAIGFLLLSACSAPDVVPFDTEASDGELVIAAVVGADGEVTRVAGVVTGDSLLAIPVEEDATLYSWTVGREDLVDMNGQPLDLGSVTIRAGTDAMGSCGRCLAPSDLPPQMLHPGSSCAIANHSRARRYTQRDGASIIASVDSAIRTSVRLELAGECPCPSEQVVDTPVQLRWRRIGQDSSSIPPQAVAADLDGTIALLADDHATIIDPSGTRTSPRDFRLQSGPVRDAVALGDRHFLIYAYHSEAAKADSFHFVGPDLTILESKLELDIDPSRMRLIVEPDMKRAFLSGKRQHTGRMVIVACKSQDEHVSCGPISPEVEGSTFFRDAVRMDSGLLVAVSATGFAFARRGSRGIDTIDDPHDPSTAWRWLIPEDVGDPRPRTVDGVEIEAFNELVAAGDRLFLCARSMITANELPSGIHVFTATISSDLDVLASRPVEWREIWSQSDGRCDGFARMPDGTLLLNTGPGSGALFSPDGRVVIDTPPFLFLRVNRFLRHLGDQFAWAQDGAVFRLSAVPGGDPLLIDGPPVWTRSRYEDLVATPGGFVAFIDQPPRMRTLSSVAGELTVSATVAIGGFSDRDYFSRAARDSTSGAMIAAGYTVTSTSDPIIPFLRRIDGGTTTEIDLPFTEGAIVDIAEVAPNQFAMIGDVHRVLWLDGEHDAVHEVPIVWDDPATSEVEVEPQASVTCRPRRFFDAGGDLFRAIDAAAGVAWAVGCEGVVLRVTKQHAERVAPAAAYAFTTVRALCADNVLVGSNGDDDPRGLGRIAELYSAGDRFAQRANAGWEQTPENVSIESGPMIDIIGDGRRLTSVFGAFQSLSAVSRILESQDRPHFSIDLRAAATDARGTIIVAGAQGFIVAGTPVE